MSMYEIQGGRPLGGRLRVQGAKNSVLPLLAAALLAPGQSVIHNCPDLSDVSATLDILALLGCRVAREGETVTVDAAALSGSAIPERLMREMRSSVIFLGALLARTGSARLCYPGGCELGPRPIDLHLTALKRLGVTISERDGFIFCECAKLKGAEILLDFPSVGATENILLAAVKAEGRTVLTGAAKEPEIVDLQNFLNAMGGKVAGAGTDVIEIEGVKELRGVSYRPMKDRIEAGTFLFAAAACGGEVEVTGVAPENIRLLLHKLRENGCKIHAKNDKINIESRGKLKCNRRIETMPFPGFPTDLQAQATALNASCTGCALIVENLFETRFKYVPELQKMGADIEVKGRTAFVRGVGKLHGASVTAGDLRGGAALVIAALGAEGVSEVLDLSHIDRGYADFRTKLKKLGASIRRVHI